MVRSKSRGSVGNTFYHISNEHGEGSSEMHGAHQKKGVCCGSRRGRKEGNIRQHGQVAKGRARLRPPSERLCVTWDSRGIGGMVERVGETLHQLF